MTVDSGATLQLGDVSQPVSTPDQYVAGLYGTGQIINGGPYSTLTVDLAQLGQDDSFPGTLGGSTSASANLLGFEVVGGHTMTLTGNNTLSRSFDVWNSTLCFAENALGATTAVDLYTSALKWDSGNLYGLSSNVHLYLHYSLREVNGVETGSTNPSVLDTNGNDVSLNALVCADSYAEPTQPGQFCEADVCFVKAGAGTLTRVGGFVVDYNGYTEIDAGALATNGYWDQGPEEYLGGPGPSYGEPTSGNYWWDSIVLAGGQIIGSDTPNGSNGTVIEYRDFFGGSGDVLPPPGSATPAPGGDTVGSCCGSATASLLDSPDVSGATGAANVSVPSADESKSLTYDSRDAMSDSGYGYGWTDSSDVPQLIPTVYGAEVTFGAESPIFFDLQPNGTYQARYGAEQTLTDDTSTDQFTLVDTDGTVYQFGDMGSPNAGQFLGSTAPGGAIVAAGYDATLPRQLDYVADYNAAEPTPYQVIGYAYTGSDVAEATVFDLNEGSLVPSRTVSYSYTAADDLEYVTTYNDWQPTGTGGHKVGFSGGSTVAGTPVVTTGCFMDPDAPFMDTPAPYYFQYYTTLSTAGTPHELERVFSPTDYENLVAAAPGHDATQATDAELAANATNYFQYGNTYYDLSRTLLLGNDGRVTAETANDGTQNYSIAYATNADAGSDDVNAWSLETVETRPDGSQFAIYANYLGEPLLTDLQQGGQNWITWNEYDDSGRLLEAVEPSGVVPADYIGSTWDGSAPFSPPAETPLSTSTVTSRPTRPTCRAIPMQTSPTATSNRSGCDPVRWPTPSCRIWKVAQPN